VEVPENTIVTRLSTAINGLAESGAIVQRNLIWA